MQRIRRFLTQLQGAGRAASESLLAREAGWLVAAKAVQGLCSLAATLAVARYLGPAPYGDLSLAIATVALLSSIATLGLEHIASRELAADRVSALQDLWRLRVLGAVLGTLLLLAASALAYSRPIGIAPLLLVMTLVPLAQVGDLGEWRLVAEGRSRRVAIVALIASPLAALLRLGMVLAGAGLVAFAWAVVAEWALRSLLMAVAVGHEAPQSPPSPRRLSLTLLRESAPLLLAGIAVFVYMRIDQFMIAAMLDRTQVGLYSAAVAVAEAPLVLPAILLRAALPVLARSGERAPEGMEPDFERLLRWSFRFHLVLALALALLAEPLLSLLYGQAYLPATSAFRLVVMGGPLVALGVLSSAWLVVHRRTGHALRRTLLGMSANILLNLVLIPAMGIAGAALATLIAQFVATYAADAWNEETRALFRVKTRAMWFRRAAAVSKDSR